jgi:hypothetical protein
MSFGVSLGTLEKRQLPCRTKNRTTLHRVMKPVTQSLHPLHRPGSYKTDMRTLFLKHPISEYITILIKNLQLNCITK